MLRRARNPGRPRKNHPQTTAAALLLLAAGGCSSPFREPSSGELRASIITSAQRELAEAQSSPSPITLTRNTSDLEFTPERRAELETMAGPTAYAGADLPDLGPDLLGGATRAFSINLEQTVARAVEENLSVQSARLAPAISRQQVAAAEAAFDWVLFADLSWQSIDEPNAVPVIGGIPIGSGASQSDNINYETGLRKQLTSGGAFSVSQGQGYRDNQSPGVSVFPDPAQSPFVNLQLSQPLLRGFGSDVALAEVRLARNLERTSIYQLKQSLLATTTDAERAYWNLALARQNLQIQQRLLERGVETRDILANRRVFDVRPAEYADAVATVERRKGNVIRAVNALRNASDELKSIINDPELTTGGEALLVPADAPVDEPITFSLLDALTAAIDNRPELQRALLNIQDASIRRQVADSLRLPLLDLTAQARFQGLNEDLGEAYEDITEAQFVDLLAGIRFEQPIGNRAGEAQYRQRQLELMQASVDYRAAVQRIVLEVKRALRQVETNYKLIEQSRTARLAATENVRTLQVLERTTQALSPDFLDLKFRRQESLANAELEEAQALVNYQIALAELVAATGTALERNGIRFVVPEAAEPSP